MAWSFFKRGKKHEAVEKKVDVAPSDDTSSADSTVFPTVDNAPQFHKEPLPVNDSIPYIESSSADVLNDVERTPSVISADPNFEKKEQDIEKAPASEDEKNTNQENSEYEGLVRNADVGSSPANSEDKTLISENLSDSAQHKHEVMPTDVASAGKNPLAEEDGSCPPEVIRFQEEVLEGDVFAIQTLMKQRPDLTGSIKYLERVKQWLLACDLEDGCLLYNLGFCCIYLNEYEEAQKWLSKDSQVGLSGTARQLLIRAVAGYPSAQYDFACIDVDRHIVHIDKVKSSFLKSAIFKGYADAIYAHAKLLLPSSDPQVVLLVLGLLRKAKTLGCADASQKIDDLNLTLDVWRHQGQRELDRLASRGNKAARLILFIHTEGGGFSDETVNRCDQVAKDWIDNASYIFDAQALTYLAKCGDVEAQYKLGEMYALGNGEIDADYEEAKAWYGEAAKQGNKDAEFALLKMAADQDGDAVAQYKLGKKYELGDGVEVNYTEAKKWYGMAAEQGHKGAQHSLLIIKAEQDGDADAQYQLGQNYALGYGVEKSEKTALIWYAKAAAQGHKKADLALLKMKAGPFNEASAQFSLALKYAEGNGIEKNMSTAVLWYRKAAEQGHTSAQNNLGVCYGHGEGVSKDYVEAAKWYRRAAEQGDDTAQSNLGLYYQYGYGVEKNLDEALRWFEKAAAQGNETAIKHLKEVRDELAQQAKEKRKKLGICPGVFFEPGSRIVEWLESLEEVGPGLSWSRVATVGSGPLQLGMMDSILSDNDLSPCYHGDETASVLIVGRNDWTEQNIEEQIEVRAGKSLHIYSQEMAMLALLTGHDPFDLDDDTLRELGEGHPASEYIINRQFTPPVIIIDSGDFDETSPLTAMGYHVGVSSDLTVRERQRLLENIYRGRLIFPADYSQSKQLGWGRPGSKTRLQRMVTHIAQNIPKHRGMGHDVAVKEWREDLNWIKKRFYSEL